MPEIQMSIFIFCFGKQIGYWDVRRGDTDATWPEILERAKRSAVDIPNAMMDILGQRVHLQNTVNAFAKCAPNAIQAVVDMHDRMLDFEYLMMGLVKNNAVPANRFLASVLGEEVLIERSMCQLSQHGRCDVGSEGLL